VGDLTIRPATESDLPRIEEISEISWRDQGGDALAEATFGRIAGKPWFDWFWPNILRKFRQHPDWVYVSEVEGAVAGFVSLSLNPGLQTGHIGYNALHPSFRGHGYGRRQIDFIIDRFRRERLQYVGVIVALNEGHRAAEAIYEKVGCQTMAVTETRLTRLPAQADIRLVDDVSVRHAALDDRDTVREIVLSCLDGIHPSCVIEARFGRIASVCWQDRAFAEWEQALHGEPSSVLLSEVHGGPAGVLRLSIDHGRKKGIVSHCLVRPDAWGAQAELPLLRAAVRAFAGTDAELLQVTGFTQGERPACSERAIAAFDLDTLVTRSATKFMRLNARALCGR